MDARMEDKNSLPSDIPDLSSRPRRSEDAGRSSSSLLYRTPYESRLPTPWEIANDSLNPGRLCTCHRPGAATGIAVGAAPASTASVRGILGFGTDGVVADSGEPAARAGIVVNVVAVSLFALAVSLGAGAMLLPIAITAGARTALVAAGTDNPTLERYPQSVSDAVICPDCDGIVRG